MFYVIIIFIGILSLFWCLQCCRNFVGAERKTQYRGTVKEMNISNICTNIHSLFSFPKIIYLDGWKIRWIDNMQNKYFTNFNYLMGILTNMQCQLSIESRSWRGVLDTTLCDKVCQWLAAGQWFSPSTPVFSTTI